MQVNKNLKPSKIIKHVALIVAIWVFCKVVLVAIESEAFKSNPLAFLGIASAMASLFLVLAYLGVDLTVKSFSYDADDYKLNVNTQEPKSETTVKNAD